MLPDDSGTGRRDTEFAAANPRAEVPVLLTNCGTPIFGSTVILGSIEEKWPKPPLLPATPLARAQARMTEEVCDTQYEAVDWGYGEILWFRRAEGSRAEARKARASHDTIVLQRWLTERLGAADWFGGTGFGWADAAVAPMVNRSVQYGLGPEPAAAPDFYRTGRRRREYRDHRLEGMIRSGGIEIVRAGLQEDTIRCSWPARVPASACRDNPLGHTRSHAGHPGRP